MTEYTSPNRARRIIVARALIVSILAAAAIAVTPHPASASCAEPPDLETAFADAPVVFIGLVVELSNGDRTAVMEVEGVWKGPDLPNTVTVNGGPSDPSEATSVDRTYELGTYIVFPINSTSPFVDNACTSTQRTTEALDVINPFLGEPVDTVDSGATTTTYVTGATQTSDTASGAAAGEAVLVETGTNRVPLFAAALAVAVVWSGILIWRRRSSSSA